MIYMCTYAHLIESRDKNEFLNKINKFIKNKKIIHISHSTITRNTFSTIYTVLILYEGE